MLKKIKDYFLNSKDYRTIKKTVTLMVINQYHDFLVSETEAKKAERKAYESMTTIGDNFSADDLQKLIIGVDKFTNNPNSKESL